LADRIIGRAYGTMCCLSVCRLSCVLWVNGVVPKTVWRSK